MKHHHLCRVLKNNPTVAVEVGVAVDEDKDVALQEVDQLNRLRLVSALYYYEVRTCEGSIVDCKSPVSDF